MFLGTLYTVIAIPLITIRPPKYDWKAIVSLNKINARINIDGVYMVETNADMLEPILFKDSKNNTSAIVAPDLMGNICEWPMIRDLADKHNLKIGDNIKLILNTDNSEVSGKVKSEIDLVNTISITGLFGEMATRMQKSENKDWSMDIPVLDYEIVTIKK